MTIGSQRKRDIEMMSDDMSTLLKSISTIKKVRKGEFLFQEGQEAFDLYLVNSGLIQISKLTVDGRELNMRISKKDDLIGELTLFADDAKYMLSAIALEDSEVLVVNKDYLEKELLKNANLTFELMKWITNQLRINQSKIRDLIMNGKKGAFYSTLIRISNSYGQQTKDGILINIHLTNHELAKFCASTRESINRMLGDLKKKSIIEMDSEGKILIKDIDYLREEIGCDLCPIEICTID
ncbi:anaerobic regulatory protein [Halobacillus andaensis]|uniref:Anaerobic regulatory protein n=1 Tax=Halobacillus andaensis TaxID=1176239 RepID=A0A917B6L7_HALAA|nr:Crp/Fnr family transcriptional regulator [Halobacillus andaensis]MBP2005771.1 CRP/FNR family transcriptional regulator [Halobacillus andaensis]GGF26159.1 anaerobic regulatory protein [Halobacillus andaensis]